MLTPDDADEVLSTLKKLTQAGQVTIVTITHKFREVNACCAPMTSEFSLEMSAPV